MTTQQLYDRMRIGFCASGQFSVEIDFRGNTYRCKSNNTLAYDCIRSENGELIGYSSEKQALLSLWNECKRKNDLK